MIFPLKLHGHPQKSAYASADEFPPLSYQEHWRAPGATVIPDVPTHVHLDIRPPIYAEMDGSPFTILFSIVIFNMLGTVTSITGTRLKSFTLDAGATLPLKANADGSPKAYTGSLTFDPSGSTSVPKHGWYSYDVFCRAPFTNRDRMDPAARFPVYSVIDPTQPAKLALGGENVRVQTVAQIVDMAEAGAFVNRWSVHTLDFVQLMPIFGPLSIDKLWRMIHNVYDYGGTGPLARGVFAVHLDPNLHAGIPGTLLAESTHDSRSPIARYNLPEGISDGPHKVKYSWTRATPDGTRELACNLVIPIVVGPGGVAQPPNEATVARFFPATPPPSTPPPPPPTPGSVVLTVVASKTTVKVGEPYTVTVTAKDAHNVKLDGEYPFMTAADSTCDGDPQLATTTCTRTVTKTQTTAGTVTHAVTGTTRGGAALPPSTVTVTVTP